MSKGLNGEVFHRKTTQNTDATAETQVAFVGKKPARRQNSIQLFNFYPTGIENAWRKQVEKDTRKLPETGEPTE